jgi:1-acyl-sn-glycerol-3-phosphate acyltransferase
VRIALTLLAAAAARAIVALVHLLTGVRAEWRGCEPAATQRIYFVNHSSHADFALLWTALPSPARRRLRPVAAADYWLRGPLRRFVIESVFRGVLIDRRRSDDRRDPLEIMSEALDAGDSLLLFPEGTRNTTNAPLLDFKRGIYKLAIARPHIELVPAWIDNVGRMLPKGEWLPVPLLCTVRFGEPLTVRLDEAEHAFLARARNALLALAPPPAGAGVVER